MSNLKISQLEKITNMKEDSFVLAVQNGKNYKMSVKEAMNSYIDLSNYYTKEETVDKINDCIEAFEVVSDKGNTTTIGRLVNTVETQGDKITELIAATDNAQSTADNALANAATAQDTANRAVTSINTINNTTIPGLQTSITSNTDLINTTKTELQTSITSNTDLINTTKTELQTSITSNTELINTTKTELIGTENTDGTTIWGAKKYTDDLINGLSSRIDSIVAGGIAFKGVVATLPSPANNGDLVIMSADYEIDGKTYKKDYEYIYSKGAWYELGDSDKNAKAIATVETKANTNATAIQSIDTAYKAADSTIKQSIETLSNAAVKKITGGNSTYVTVTAGTKDNNGNVTLTVTDTIANTFDTQDSVNSKIDTAKITLIGTSSDSADLDTINGAKKYTDDLVNELSTRVDSIVAGGVAFKGVVTEMPSNPQNGDLVIIGKEGGITVGDITYKKDYEYIYSNGTWYELGDSDKNAKAIAAVESKANTNASAIQRVETEYKAADNVLEFKINVIGNALIGDNTDGSDADTIWGAKNYAMSLVSALVNSFVAITDEQINGLFTV